MIKDLIPTIDDLPTNKANCLTCTRKSVLCWRRRHTKSNPNDYLKSPNGEIGGMVCWCPHYTGEYEH